MNTCDNVLECSLLSAKSLALTKQAFSENSEKLKIEMLTNKDANRLIEKVLNFEKMLVTYVGHDFAIDFEDLLNTVL